jgi:hypothetical protein
MIRATYVYGPNSGRVRQQCEVSPNRGRRDDAAFIDLNRNAMKRDRSVPRLVDTNRDIGRGTPASEDNHSLSIRFSPSGIHIVDNNTRSGRRWRTVDRSDFGSD